MLVDKNETCLCCTGKRIGSGSLWQEVNQRSLCQSEKSFHFLVFFQKKLASLKIRGILLWMFLGRHLHTRTPWEWKATTTWLLFFIGSYLIFKHPNQNLQFGHCHTSWKSNVSNLNPCRIDFTSPGVLHPYTLRAQTPASMLSPLVRGSLNLTNP